MKKHIFFRLLSLLFVSLLVGCSGDSGGGTPATATNSAPVITSSAAVSVNENQTSALTVTATDAESDVLTYSLTGVDASNFTIDSASGVVTFINPPDFETKNQYLITANVSDGTNTTTQNITINISDVAESSFIVPTLADSILSVAENSLAGTVVGSVTISSIGDSAITTITLTGTGSTNFTVATDGTVTVASGATLDYETTTSYSLTAVATNSAGDSSSVTLTINITDVNEAVAVNIPTVVVVMNWTNYFESDPALWYDKIFNQSTNSVNRWFHETTKGNLQLAPITESSGTANDGIIMVNMNKAHPGDYNYVTFRDTEITNAITNPEVVNNADFAALDLDGNGALDRKELNIIFIVAGGESSYADPVASSIWAHAWCFDSGSTLTVDGKFVMKYNLDDTLSGWYGRFGANHGDHKATIGVIAHEIGHSVLALGDYYDPFGNSSGLGQYDIMSGGGWAYQTTDTYQGETPTQFSAHNRIDINVGLNVINLNASADVTIECSSNQLIKLLTTKANEYFLVECRDTSKASSDISLNRADNTFTEDRLFMNMYHVDTLKTDNSESGVQTSTWHYKVALVEKNTSVLLTHTTNLTADFSDVYTLGEVIDSTKTKLYDTTPTGYILEVLNENYTDRTMTIRITK